MSHTLVTFLGKSRENKDTGYRKTIYRFPDGTKDETAFFGLALSRHLKPDATVILGTRSSQWGVLVEHLVRGDQDEDARLRLFEAEDDGSVTQPLLNDVAPLMKQAVGGDVYPRLIPFGQDTGEQYAILDAVADAVPNGAVSFDLTHGFRHLGMVGFLSAFMLERVRKLEVRDLWYGALDMTRDDGVTPVLKLDGLVRVRRWVDALDRFDATGDYGVFAPLLIDDGVPKDKADCLKEAAFYERNFNVPDAARKIGTFLPVLDGELAGASGQFQDLLKERLRWTKVSALAEQQRELAHQYLNRGDFVRAAMFGREACVNHLCEARGVTTGKYSQEREEVVKDFEAELKCKQHSNERKTAYWMLTNLRNSLAHGTPPASWDRHSRAALKDPDRLRRELKNSLDRFFE